MTNQQIERLAARYWSQVPSTGTFPRNLEESVFWGFPIVVSTMADLTLAAVYRWLADRNILRDAHSQDRPLHACLAAVRGHGFIFLNGTDSVPQRRFSLAHEIAHFIVDYDLPRQHAIEALGESIIPVMDGDRQPSVEERLTGAMRQVRLGSFDHMMDRTDAGYAFSMQVIEAEDNADRLALELLAPRKEVMQQVGHSEGGNLADKTPKTQRILIQSFGLPDEVAGRYARFLSASDLKKQTFRDWIGK